MTFNSNCKSAEALGLRGDFSVGGYAFLAVFENLYNSMIIILYYRVPSPLYFIGWQL